MKDKLLKSKFGMYHGANANSQSKASDLRKRRTKAELILWESLKTEKVLNCKFRQQHPIVQFIVDFYSHSIKLVIEVDGDVHNSEETKEYDENRTIFLNDLGITVIHFTNELVEQNIEKVVSDIKNTIIKIQLEE
jgi:very-short-patch-repair endonuclease